MADMIERAKQDPDFDKGVALMVYETWLLNGASEESLPSIRLQKWCNRQLHRELFPLRKPVSERARGA